MCAITLLTHGYRSLRNKTLLGMVLFGVPLFYFVGRRKEPARA